MIAHLVRSRLREIAPHPEGPLGDAAIECYVTGSRDVFALGWTLTSSGSVALLRRDVSPSDPQLQGLGVDLSTWAPVVQDRALVPWIAAEPSPEAARNARRPPNRVLAALEAAWAAGDVRADAADVEAALVATAAELPAPVALRYASPEEHAAVFLPLLTIEADASRVAEEARGRRGVQVKWLPPLSDAGDAAGAGGGAAAPAAHWAWIPMPRDEDCVRISPGDNIAFYPISDDEGGERPRKLLSLAGNAGANGNGPASGARPPGGPVPTGDVFGITPVASAPPVPFGSARSASRPGGNGGAKAPSAPQPFSPAEAKPAFSGVVRRLDDEREAVLLQVSADPRWKPPPAPANGYRIEFAWNGGPFNALRAAVRRLGKRGAMTAGLRRILLGAEPPAGADGDDDARDEAHGTKAKHGAKKKWKKNKGNKNRKGGWEGGDREEAAKGDGEPSSQGAGAGAKGEGEPSSQGTGADGKGDGAAAATSSTSAEADPVGAQPHLPLSPPAPPVDAGFEARLPPTGARDVDGSRLRYDAALHEAFRLPSAASAGGAPAPAAPRAVPWDALDPSAPGLARLNEWQAEAVRASLSSTLTLVQGPPGTGKTQMCASTIYRMVRGFSAADARKAMRRNSQGPHGGQDGLDGPNGEVPSDGPSALGASAPVPSSGSGGASAPVPPSSSYGASAPDSSSTSVVLTPSLRTGVPVPPRSGRALVAAPSNVAVDNLAVRLQATGLRVVRVFARSREGFGGDAAALSPAELARRVYASGRAADAVAASKACTKDPSALLSGAVDFSWWPGAERTARWLDWADERERPARAGRPAEAGGAPHKASSGSATVAVARSALVPRRFRDDVEVPPATLQVLMRSVITCAEAVVCTCVVAHDQRVTGLTFSSVLVDEAAQAIEPEALVPLTCGATRVALVGDHKQLGPTVISPLAASAGLSMSLFERLTHLGVVPHRLLVQYRMPPSLAAWPALAFYDGVLQSARVERDATRGATRAQPRAVPGEAPGEGQGPERGKALAPAAWSAPPPWTAFPWPTPAAPLAFWAVQGVEELASNGTSFLNRLEAEAVVAVVATLLKSGVAPGSLGVVTPYVGQRSRILKALRAAPDVRAAAEAIFQRQRGAAKEASAAAGAEANAAAAKGGLSSVAADLVAKGPLDSVAADLGAALPSAVSDASYRDRLSNVTHASYLGIEVASVDEFQGREKEYIIFSCTRTSTRGIGFLADPRRLNVAVTRAREGLVLLGSPAALVTDPLWSWLIAHCSNAGAVVQGPTVGALSRIRVPQAAASRAAPQRGFRPVIWAGQRRADPNAREAWKAEHGLA